MHFASEPPQAFPTRGRDGVTVTGKTGDRTACQSPLPNPSPYGLFWMAPVMGTKSTGRSSLVWIVPRSSLLTTMSRCTS